MEPQIRYREPGLATDPADHLPLIPCANRLVSPYSWSYRGGVNRHVEALAEEFLGRGHDVRVLAPFDPPGPAQPRPAPGGAGTAGSSRLFVPLGRTVGFGANGAVSNLSPFPAGGFGHRGARSAPVSST